LVAHNGGAGWVQALGDVVFGALFIGIVGPSVVLARSKIRVLSAPTDGTAGLPVEVQIDASTRLRVRAVDPPGLEILVGPIGKRRTPDDGATLMPDRRGVYETLTLDVATAAPFGLQWWTHRVQLPLPAALHVAPRRGQPVTLPVRPLHNSGESVQRAAALVGEPRGARVYRPGDNRRHVHWRATAHAGELMVREMEQATSEPITVTVTLPRDPDEAERVAERALATVVLSLDRDVPVLLGTVERSGPVVAPVLDRRSAGRRLARAVASVDMTVEASGVSVTP
jgi:uncharacterized protein (DUF58 family)